ncbi:MAG TPA: cupredoxin family copper-binding protein [Acidimicrobiales bacterium]|nr:cupredoxin family copper-binding protein [Acidimicrobiales bacterium]
MRATGLAAAVFAAVLALGACGSDSDDDKASITGDTDTTATAAETEDTADDMTGGGEAGTAITIKDFKFAPETLKAKVGDKITVTNEDSAIHTLTAKDKSFDTGNLDQGAEGTITVSKAGTVEYFCNIHDYMTGTIEVR